MLKRFNINDSERALLFKQGRLQDILGPGSYRYFNWGQALTTEIYQVTNTSFTHVQLPVFLELYREKLEQYLDIVELSETQVGVVYRNNTLFNVLAPGSCFASWKGSGDIKVEIFDINDEYRMSDQLIKRMGLAASGGNIDKKRVFQHAFLYTEVQDEHVGLLQVNGKLEQVLPRGQYAFWRFNRSINVKLIDMRAQTMDVKGQEILTKDRVSLRINLAANYKVKDAKLAALSVQDFNNYVYLSLQLRLREAVGTKTLDELLEDKDSLNITLAKGLMSALKDHGIELINVGVKDIVLPGDMKVILNQVVEAQKSAEANLIKRREETQAMRSLHNTAKVMENNPVLLRLKELETLEKVTEKIDRISVYGGLDSVLNDLVKLAPNKA